jgi:putative ABC transport system permease protein
MTLSEVLRSAVRGLAANRLRSGLTTLGILIGVGAVIVLVAVGNGSGKQIQASIEQLGTNTLTIFSGGFGRGRASTGLQASNQSLTLPLAQALADPAGAPDIATVTPEVSGSATVTYAGATHSTSVLGTYPSYFAATNSPVGSGTAITATDVARLRKTAVIGQTVATDLFGTASPIGRTIQIGGVPFSVTGVLKAKDAAGPNDPNDTVIVPLPAAQAWLTGYGPISTIVVQAKDARSVDAAQAEATAILNRRLHVTSTASTPYQILNQSQLLATRTSASDTFTVLLASVAAISLLVGGIGITNIMLVTVTERTREIGIRKALGATKRAILAQFLAEATLLSLVGGILGVAAGAVGTRFQIVGIDPVIVPSSIAAALAVAVAIGVFFGSYPANRAASLRPVEALRHE